MDNLELLSDEELRLRLLQYGYQNLPITQTTRKILIKKLRNAAAAEKSKVRGDTSMATSFSSGEESDGIDGPRWQRISGRPTTTSTTTTTTRHRKTSPKINAHVSPLLWGGASNGNESDDDSRGFNGFSASDLDRSNGSNGSVSKRLMALRADTLLRNNDLQRSPGITSPNEIVCHAAPEPETRSTPPRPLSVAISNLINKLDEHYGLKQTFVPCVLIFCFIAFFILIAGMYLTISPNIQSTISAKSAQYSLCKENVRIGGCFQSQETVDNSLDFVRLIIKELQRRAEAVKCGGGSTESHIMSLDTIRKYLEDIQMSDNFPKETITGAQNLIAKNPQWRIQIMSGDSGGFAILEPVLPFSCIIKNKLRKFFTIVGSIILICGTAFVSSRIYRYVKCYKATRKEIVNNLIVEITNAVIEQAALDEGAVIVTHLRDKLLPISKRKELDWAWIEAVRTIEETESRIQFEVGNRNGEDYRMMRWIDATPTVTSNDGRPVKTWQSPAFDKSNKIKDPPTPCLKIRQMFDKFDANDPTLKQVITDAILAKVAGSACRVYDVQLDKASCCVYVRCASNADAGIVHDQINGWWFDTRLVSIKFLRLERYLSRFPQTDTGVPSCLKPTSYASIASASSADDDMND